MLAVLADDLHSACGGIIDDGLIGERQARRDRTADQCGLDLLPDGIGEITCPAVFFSALAHRLVVYPVLAGNLAYRELPRAVLPLDDLPIRSLRLSGRAPGPHFRLRPLCSSFIVCTRPPLPGSKRIATRTASAAVFPQAMAAIAKGAPLPSA